MNPTSRCLHRHPMWLIGLLAAALVLPGIAQAQITSSHPRIILDNATLAALRQHANVNTPQWQSLKTYCDTVLDGTIAGPVPDTWESLPSIGSNYQGQSYIRAVMNLGLCYRVMQGINANSANAYGDKLAEVLDTISQPFPGPNGVFSPDDVYSGNTHSYDQYLASHFPAQQQVPRRSEPPKGWM